MYEMDAPMPSVLLEIEHEERQKKTSRKARLSSKAVIYARVSSPDQDEDGYSKDAQVKSLRRHAERKDIRIAEEFVVVESAFKRSRLDVFNKMIAFIRANSDVRHILVEKPDRLHRSDTRKLDIKNLVDELDVKVHFVKDNFILSRESRASEKLKYDIDSAVGVYHSENVSEETSKGMREKAEQGIYPSFAPLGYLNDNKGIIIDERRALIIEKLFNLYATGKYSVKESTKIAREHGLSFRGSGTPISRSTVSVILHNPIYTGWFKWKGKIYRGTHEPIVSIELFERVQDVFKSRYAAKPRRGARVFAFSQLITCGKCGCLIVGELKKKKYAYYHCSNFKGECRGVDGLKYVREESVEQQFAHMLGRFDWSGGELVEWMREVLRSSRFDKCHELEDSIQRLRADYDINKNRIDGAYIDKLDGKINWDRYEGVSKKCKEEMARCADSIERHEQAMRSYSGKEADILRLASNPQSLLNQLTANGKQQLLKLMLSKCEWCNGEIVAEFHEPFDKLVKRDNAVDITKAEKLLADTQAAVDRLEEELKNAPGYATAMLYIAEFHEESDRIDREWEKLSRPA